ncbi:hypothetical protein ACFFJB_01970 [Camelimonas abortus]|uniref:hypothetical protein n=1 Tax=Camelimonas abortus TaxID=1017184 RepID=UPI0035E85249
MSRKANVEDARPLPSSGMADAAIGGGSVLGCDSAGRLKVLVMRLTPLAGGSATVNGIVAVCWLSLRGACFRRRYLAGAAAAPGAAQVADALGYAVAA